MKYLVHIPLMVIPLIVYNALMLFGEAVATNQVMFTVPHATKEAGVPVGLADLVLGLAIIVLYVEILKAARVSRSTTIDHMLSMVVFIVFLVEAILVAGAGTSTFVLLTLVALLDVVAGFTISIATARRDLALGGDGVLG